MKVQRWVLAAATGIRSGVRRTVGEERRRHSKGLLQEQKGIGTGRDHLLGHRTVDRFLSSRGRAGDARVPRRAVQQTTTGGGAEPHP